MDRRRFVGQGLSLAGLAALHTSGASACAPLLSDQPLHKKSLKWGMIQEDLSVIEKFRLVKSLGFHGIELDSPDDISIEEVLQAKEETGLEIPGLVNSVHWKKPLSHADAAIRKECVDAMIYSLELCRRLGGDTVLLVPAVVNEGVSYDDAWDRSTEEIKKLIPIAEKHGVSIALENVWNNFLLSPVEARHYVDQFDSDKIGWYMDIGNIIRYGWPEQWIRILGERILKIDIKDYSRELANDQGVWKGFQAKLGEGSVDWSAVNSSLRDIGYRGWGSAEVRGGDRDRLSEISSRMDMLYSK